MEDKEVKVSSVGLINMTNAPSPAAASNEAGEMPPQARKRILEKEIAESAADLGTEEEILDENYDSDDLDMESEESYLEGLDDGLNSASELTKINTDSIFSKRENTRSTLAIVYTIATFLVFIMAMLIAVLDGLVRKVSIIDNLAAVIPLVSGVFFGTLGFVLGYYFRKGEE